MHDVDAAPGSGPQRLSRARDEAALALEIAALSAFVFARPVLASFGAAPEVFIAESAGRVDIVAFALAVLALPVVAAVVVGVAVRRAVPGWRMRLHVVALGALAALAGWQVVVELSRPPLVMLAMIGSVVGVGAAIWRMRSAVPGTFLRYGALVGVVFLGQFAVGSPAAGLIWRTSEADQPDADVVAALRASGAPPVVLVILDEMPTATLLDGDGSIDASLFPSFARLASDSTWYRNHTTVAGSTPQAVGAIVGGRVIDADVPPTASSVPDNLFTLLAPVYDVHGREQLTAYCPPDLCAVATGGSQVPALLEGGAGLWGRYMARGGSPGIPTRSEDRLLEFEEWIDDQSFRPGDRPDLFVHHVVLPHAPWEHRPDGVRYRAPRLPAGASPDQTWSHHGVALGVQRHVLQTQAIDRALGRLLDQLSAAGAYDESIIVVTADHGTAFVPGEPRRAATDAQYEQIAWSPLIVKAAGQRSAVVSDANVQSVDIVPTILDLIGADDVFEGDGRPAAEAPERGEDGWDDKEMVPGDGSTLEVTDDGRVPLDATAGFERLLRTDLTPGTGEQAAWEHVPGVELVGRPLSSLREAEPAEVRLDDDISGPYGDVDLGAPLPLEVDVTAELPDGAPVVAAVDGTIAGTSQVEADEEGGHIHLLLRPESLVSGPNDVRLYLVESESRELVLRHLRPP